MRRAGEGVRDPSAFQDQAFYNALLDTLAYLAILKKILALMKGVLLASLTSLALVGLATKAEAAIFRLQSTTADTGNPPTYNYGALTFSGTVGPTTKNFSVTGEFRVKTDYTDANGVIQQGDNSLQAWNIRVVEGSNSYRYSFGYSSPEMGSLSDTSTAGTPASNFFQVNCSDSSQCGVNAGFLNFQFSSTFDSATRDSAGNTPGNSISATAANIRTNASDVFSSASTTPAVISGQADFVPFTPAIFGLLPLASLLSRLRSTTSLSNILK